MAGKFKQVMYAGQELVDESGGGGGDITVESLTCTENKTYTAPEGKAYSPVTVNVSGGGEGALPFPKITVSLTITEIDYIDTIGFDLYDIEDGVLIDAFPEDIEPNVETVFDGHVFPKNEDGVIVYYFEPNATDIDPEYHYTFTYGNYVNCESIGQSVIGIIDYMQDASCTMRVTRVSDK